MHLKVILSDDHKIVREGLKNLLNKSSDIEIVAESENGRDTVLLAEKLKPDIVIMDVTMPELNGIEATRQIIKNNPNIKVIALTMHSERQFVVEMLKAGAKGYLIKDCAFDELVNAIKTVAGNKVYISPSIAHIVVGSISADEEHQNSSFKLLTDREREILQLLAEGKATKEIAFSLEISIKTVETYRQLIMNKLKIYNIAELTKYAIREGLTSVEK